MWWALFLTHEFGGILMRGNQDVRSSLLEELMFWPVSIAAAVLALRVVRQISAAQLSRR